MTQKGKDRVSWKLAASTVPLGLLFAALTISGSLRGVDVTKWTALGLLVVIAVWVALRAPTRPLRHGLAAGFLAALAAIWAQALLLETYFANNPGYAGIQVPLGLSARQATFLLGPANALLAGLVTGALAWLLGRARQRIR
jgi:hypothetical protein